MDDHDMNRKGFTLIELLVVIAIIGILASVVLVSIQDAKMKSHDGRRLEDMRQMQLALELYYDRYGFFPGSDYQGSGGWDTGGDGDFVEELVSEGLLQGAVLDPVTNDANGNYRYYRYDAGGGGCDSTRGGFYILGIVDMPTQGNPAKTSPGFSCPGRNWQGEFDWVAGAFEN